LTRICIFPDGSRPQGTGQQNDEGEGGQLQELSDVEDVEMLEQQLRREPAGTGTGIRFRSFLSLVSLLVRIISCTKEREGKYGNSLSNVGRVAKVFFLFWFIYL
jgi:hypothetical protein